DYRSGCDSFFFFSSRRRHTRFKCDWSSDVCSSDLQSGRRAWLLVNPSNRDVLLTARHAGRSAPPGSGWRSWKEGCYFRRTCPARSEEGRVGKEGRCGGGADECRREEGGTQASE